MHLLNVIAISLSSQVFAADSKIQENIQRHFGRKTTLIPNSVDTKVFRPKKKVISQIPTIMSIGRLEPQKNFSMLISAVGQIKKKPKLLIVGQGSQKLTLLQKAKQNQVDLELIDKIPNLELPKLLNIATIYVQPSLMEAPVKTLLEAMSCELPVIGTDVPGIRDVIEDGRNGLICQLTAENLAGKITRLLNDTRLARSLGKSARQTIKLNYDQQKIVGKEIKILKSL